MQFDEVLALGEQIEPDQLLEKYWFAWFLADCVDPQFRKPELANDIAQRLVDEAPHVGEYRIALGIARYRLEQYQSAIDALEESSNLNKYYVDGGYARLFRAMAHQKREERDKALKQYELAIAEMETEYDWLWPRLNRAEAERLLRIQKPGNEKAATDQ
jgi:tetratricopeptide (TPR) repeat protein